MFAQSTRVFLLAFLMTLCFQARAAQTAKATAFCWSLRFQQGRNLTNDNTLDLSTVPGPPNGELKPWFNVYTHRSAFVLNSMGGPIAGTLYLNIYSPPSGQFLDTNGDGFDDNFQVSQPSATSTRIGASQMNARCSILHASKRLPTAPRLIASASVRTNVFRLCRHCHHHTKIPARNALNCSVICIA